MGCCQSSTRHQDSSSSPHSDPSSRNHTSARRRTATSNVAPPIITHNDPSPSSRRSQRQRQQQQQNTSENLSQPLRKHIWTSKRPCTRAELDREREEFFDTRVTGRSETWHAIRMAIETMAEGDLSTAQTILDAAGVVLPTGDLVDGVYDEVGNFYQIPEYCVADPVNLIITTTQRQSNGTTFLSGSKGEDEDEGEDDDEEETSFSEETDTSTLPRRRRRRRRRREDKGKGKPPPAQDPTTKTTIRARLSDRGGPDLRIDMSRDQPVRILIRKIQEEIGIGPTSSSMMMSSGGEPRKKGKENLLEPNNNNNNKRKRKHVRIAYLGKILRENESLPAQGWKEGHVVNALVFT